MRRITKLGLTLGVLAVASFLAPGKSPCLFLEAKRSAVCACVSAPPSLPPCVCVCLRAHCTLDVYYTPTSSPWASCRMGLPSVCVCVCAGLSLNLNLPPPSFAGKTHDDDEPTHTIHHAQDLSHPNPFDASAQARTAYMHRSSSPSPFRPFTHSHPPPHPPLHSNQLPTHTVPVQGTEGLTEMPEGLSEDKVMEDMAKANGIDPENFDYDKWLEEQKLDIAGEDKE